MSDTLDTVRKRWPALAVGLIAFILMIALGSRGGDDGQRPQATPEVASTASAPQTSATSGASGTETPPDDGLPTISTAKLPPEARSTLALIEAGGPYPYDQDSSVFQNREGILPEAPRGTYREYTVETPGESDRGSRRIVTAKDGSIYYTDDHYESFRRVLR